MSTRKRVALICNDPSLAIQSQKDEADINNIVRNFGVTGRLPGAVTLPTYGDFTGVDDYRSALEAVNAAQNAFMQIPSAIRAQFDHDPGAWADFAANPANLPQLREWGLAPPASTPEPQGEPAHKP